MIKEYLQGIWKDRYVLFGLVKKDLQLKYKRSKLGVAWAVLTPLGLVVIIGSVYSIVFGMSPKELIPMLFAGLNPWLFMSGCADSGTMAFICAEGYIKQTSVNPQIFPLRMVFVNFVNFLHSIFAFFLIYLFIDPLAFSPYMLMCIPGIIIIFFFSCALANIAAVINLGIRDYQPLQSLLFQGLFYVTPIIFPASMLKQKGFEIVYYINPFYYLIEIIKTPIQGKIMPEMFIYLVAICFTIILFLFSVYMIMKQKKHIVFKL